jgi:hypothetical protein
MKFQKSFVAAGLAMLALGANAQSFSSVAAGPGDYAAPVFSTPNGLLAYVANDTVANVRSQPLFDAPGTFLIVSTLGSATINLGGATSFSFLWGSPDPTNMIDIDGVLFTGLTLLGGTANSSNANTQWATFTSDTGMNSFTMTTNQIAFEIAVANPVPEPETYALLLGGLGALAFVVRRRKV